MTNRPIPRQIADIDDLLKHKGWQLISSRMADEIALITRRLTDNPAMPTDQLHYYRGVIAAATRLLGVPEAVKAALTNELILQNAKAATAAKAKTPATAGL